MCSFLEHSLAGILIIYLFTCQTICYQFLFYSVDCNLLLSLFVLILKLSQICPEGTILSWFLYPADTSTWLKYVGGSSNSLLLGARCSKFILFFPCINSESQAIAPRTPFSREVLFRKENLWTQCCCGAIAFGTFSSGAKEYTYMVRRLSTIIGFIKHWVAPLKLYPCELFYKWQLEINNTNLADV